MFSTIQKAILPIAFGGLVFLLGTTNASGQEAWHAHVDWAAHNSDAGGSVDCPADYAANGVAYAIVSGGRAAVINAALFAAAHQDFNHAFDLVLMTQCHNPGARTQLSQAGRNAVLTYLLEHYTPTGIDPDQVVQMASKAIEILAAAQ